MNFLGHGFQKLEHYRPLHRQMWPNAFHAGGIERCKNVNLGARNYVLSEAPEGSLIGDFYHLIKVPLQLDQETP